MKLEPRKPSSLRELSQWSMNRVRELEKLNEAPEIVINAEIKQNVGEVPKTHRS